MKMLYNTQTRELLPWPYDENETNINLEPHLLEMNVVGQIQPPPYDPATQTLNETIAYSVEKRTVFKNWYVSDIVIPTYGAEEWLFMESYTPLRLLTCLDLEAKLNAAQKSSPKMTAVRQWLDGITLLAAPNPDQARNDWAPAPHTFAEASSEALTVLAS